MSTLQDTVRSLLSTGCCGSSNPDKPRNINEGERLVSAAAGAMLVKLGAQHRGLSGLVGIGLGAAMIHRGYTGHCALYKKLGVDYTRPAAPSSYFDHGIHVTASVLVNKPADDLYTFWKKFENLPAFMDHLVSVTLIDAKRSHWVARGPMGTEVKWDAEVINDIPNDTIAWRSLAGAQVDNAGSVRFIPRANGTEVRVTLDYIPPGRQLGQWVAKLFGEEPTQQIKHDLAKFKQMMETGMVGEG